jgi:hypothetical protein
VPILFRTTPSFMATGSVAVAAWAIAQSSVALYGIVDNTIAYQSSQSSLGSNSGGRSNVKMAAGVWTRTCFGFMFRPSPTAIKVPKHSSAWLSFWATHSIAHGISQRRTLASSTFQALLRSSATNRFSTRQVRFCTGNQIVFGIWLQAIAVLGRARRRVSATRPRTTS